MHPCRRRDGDRGCGCSGSSCCGVTFHSHSLIIANSPGSWVSASFRPANLRFWISSQMQFRLSPNSCPVSLVLGPDRSVWVPCSTHAGLLSGGINNTPSSGRWSFLSPNCSFSVDCSRGLEASLGRVPFPPQTIAEALIFSGVLGHVLSKSLFSACSISLGTE